MDPHAEGMIKTTTATQRSPYIMQIIEKIDVIDVKAKGHTAPPHRGSPNCVSLLISFFDAPGFAKIEIEGGT
jgi:hypothetical protein